MVDPSNNSFIPKRGATKQKRTNASKRIYLFALTSYILMFASLLSAGGIYLYDKYYVHAEFDKAVTNLHNSINSFSEANLQQVIDFDLRLQQANNRLSNSVSVPSILAALENATIDTVKINDLDISRVGDEKFTLKASIETDSFDSTIFQRDVYGRSEDIAKATIPSVNIVDSKDELDSPDRKTLTFVAELDVPLSVVPFIPSNEVVGLSDTESVSEPKIEVASPDEVELKTLDN